MLITRSNRPQRAAAQAAQFIAGLPKSSVAPQGTTNIIAFLEFGDFDCANGGQILLITDGIEASIYADPNALLKGKVKLPTPEPGFLKGCSVTFYGLGAEQSAQEAKNIRDAWKRWFETAGAPFTAVMP